MVVFLRERKQGTGEMCAFRKIPTLFLAFIISCTLASAQTFPVDSYFQPNTSQGEKDWAINLTQQAEHGSPEAQHLLSKAYMNGNVFKRNVPQAMKWSRMAAIQGFAEAEVNMGTLYYEGKYVPRDYTETRYWMQKAAAQGNPKGEYNLGVLYAYGQGVQRNLPEAIRWYQKAAEHGHQAAAYNMGVSYFQGIGVPKDEVKSYMWHYVGATYLHFAMCAGVVKQMDAKLDPAKLAEGRKQARAWIRAHPNLTPVPMES